MDQYEFGQHRRRFFEHFHKSSPAPEPWHAATRQFIHKTTRTWFESSRNGRSIETLNAGSGGADYGISQPMVHLDLYTPANSVPGKVVIANIEEIPMTDCVFDAVLCVGSVINYCDPIRCLSEISRVSRAGALLILEYERSASAEFFWQSGFGSSAARFQTFFGSESTYLWAYSDRFINAALDHAGFRVIKNKYFQCASAVGLALSLSPKNAAKLARLDPVVRRIPGLRSFASNRILMANKIPNDRNDKFNRL